MEHVELYGRVRYVVKIQGMSHRVAAWMFDIDRRTVDKMLVIAAPRLSPQVGTEATQTGSFRWHYRLDS